MWPSTAQAGLWRDLSRLGYVDPRRDFSHFAEHLFRLRDLWHVTCKAWRCRAGRLDLEGFTYEGFRRSQVTLVNITRILG